MEEKTNNAEYFEILCSINEESITSGKRTQTGTALTLWFGAMNNVDEGLAEHRASSIEAISNSLRNFCENLVRKFCVFILSATFTTADEVR